ncbi:MAG TPA: hypothetical protein VMF06_16550 [Candidatus Limnocylindria bacterium]|jgi:hypothetical protein|nr:hypothetical protein [Candidatus Limnocylindria bacterium]
MKTLRCLVAVAALFFNLLALAHVGSPNVVVEGLAGPYSVRVFVRPPTVVPGVAEITVRVLEGQVQSVTVLPVYWQTGRAGAPSPDAAKSVPGETNLFTGGLWLMKSGTYSIDVTASGSQGTGTLVVPVNSIATNTKPMPRAFTLMLAALGFLLVAGMVTIVGSVFGESLSEPGPISQRVRRNSRIAMGVAVAILALGLYGGRLWWDLEEKEYRQRRLYRPTLLVASVASKNEWPYLRLKIDGKAGRSLAGPLLPDHGKIMHLFAIRKDGQDAFAHLHPVSGGDKSYGSPVPPLPAGIYELYADVTYENGFAETWTTTTEFPAAPRSVATPSPRASGDAFCAVPVTVGGQVIPFDHDDSWHTGAPLSDGASEAAFALPGGLKMVWLNKRALLLDEESLLQFQLVGPDGKPASIGDYMGMAGHAALRLSDGSVFAHLHPGGTISMASQAYFINRDNPKSAGSGTNAVLPVAYTDHVSHTNTLERAQVVSFPYAFPKTGAYRIWVQMKSGEQVYTGVFDAVVEAKTARTPAS